MSRRKKVYSAIVFFFISVLCIYILSEASSKTFHGPDDLYLLHHKRHWSPIITDGAVTFTRNDELPGTGVSVTLVMAKALSGWGGDFENALAKAFAIVGSDYQLLEKSTRRFNGGDVNRYAYTVVLDGRPRKNVVYVFETGADKAAVMTCSAIQGQDMALEKVCQDFAAGIRTPLFSGR